MKKLLKKLGDWLDRRDRLATRKKCLKRGHDWTLSGRINPSPALFYECRRYGCDARTELTPATMTWEGERCVTLSPKG